MPKHNVIDCHHHLWDLNQNNHPWLIDEPKDIWIGDYDDLCVDFSVDDFKACSTQANIIKSVHIQAMTRNSLTETAWLQQQSNEQGLPNGIVFYADLAAKNIEQVIQQHMVYNNVRGIRQIINEHKDPRYNMCPQHDLMQNELWQQGFALLEPYKLSFDLQCYDYQLPQATNIAAMFPNTHIILNHMGMPIKRNAASLESWRRHLETFASKKNTAIKLSGLAMLNQPMDKDISRQMLRDAIDIFGWQRALFASNFPVDSLFHHYDDWFTLVLEATSHLTSVQQQAIWVDNAERLYRI